MNSSHAQQNNQQINSAQIQLQHQQMQVLASSSSNGAASVAVAMPPQLADLQEPEVPLSLYPPNSDNILTSDKWFISDPTRFSVPKFKQCKDKDYCDKFSDVFYKTPYKYQLSVTMTKNMNGSSQKVSTSSADEDTNRKEGAHVLMMQLLFDNLETVHLGKAKARKKSKGRKSATTRQQHQATVVHERIPSTALLGGVPAAEGTLNSTVPSTTDVAVAAKSRKNNAPDLNEKSGASTEVLSGSVAVFRDLLMKDCKEAVFGSLAFHDVCSYKMGGRDFRLCLYVVELPVNLSLDEFEKRMKFYDPRNSIPLSAGSQVIGKLISPSFTIRAKKPSTRTSSKKRKKAADATTNAPNKRLKTDDKMNSMINEFSSFNEENQKKLLSTLMAQSSDQVRGMVLRECMGANGLAALLMAAAASAGTPNMGGASIQLQQAMQRPGVPNFLGAAEQRNEEHHSNSDSDGSSLSAPSEVEDSANGANNNVPLDGHATDRFDSNYFSLEVDESLFFNNQIL
eukprot:CAMPEP_0117453048 /NCGR_PEP_ID=MMETSP0759-20121206/9989_1 /TAXON_ID=63605 /ORGANISM="Percolomonas cosmopolitus, Strain WS" /LENGTH=510 /DNA_ID=CAMNT_0005246001 /DNA_START=564 /DNA_END=2096 /DNA_ORIENTATION=-